MAQEVETQEPTEEVEQLTDYFKRLIFRTMETVRSIATVLKAKDEASGPSLLEAMAGGIEGNESILNHPLENVLRAAVSGSNQGRSDPPASGSDDADGGMSVDMDITQNFGDITGETTTEAVGNAARESTSKAVENLIREIAREVESA